MSNHQYFNTPLSHDVFQALDLQWSAGPWGCSETYRCEELCVSIMQPQLDGLPQGAGLCVS